MPAATALMGGKGKHGQGKGKDGQGKGKHGQGKDQQQDYQRRAVRPAQFGENCGASTEH